jgi:carbon storage regulator
LLVLTRKIGEKVKIEDNISIIIMDIKGKHVKLGIEAPSNIAVHREEIYFKIKEENINAAKVKLLEFEKIKELWKKKK